MHDFELKEKTNSFLRSSDSDIKKLVANAVPESTRKSTKYAANLFEGEESYEQTLGILSYTKVS